jgi:hypothetical protein
MKCSYFTSSGEKLPPDMSEVILNSFKKRWLSKNFCSTRNNGGKIIY